MWITHFSDYKLKKDKTYIHWPTKKKKTLQVVTLTGTLLIERKHL